MLLQAGRGWDALRHVSARILRILLERLPRYRVVKKQKKKKRKIKRILAIIILQRAIRAYVRATSATRTQVAACARP